MRQYCAEHDCNVPNRVRHTVCFGTAIAGIEGS
jgi:hypothetical protein